MALSAGDRLGHYEITAPLGAGGMGEVYRATDTRLGREVAIKILPEDVAADPDRLARFEREAKVLASLNHPNIATLFGLENVEGKETMFLAMELVEGEDLAERIGRKPVPLRETIAIGRQIADGLEAAHTAGIVHRDLKPANIRITPDGTVKILDFGLAKEWGQSPGDPDFTNSPTATAEMTRAGTILGTAPYLSPEQAVGKAVDRRTDIWAFGCVLFEMLSGRRAFPGGSSTEILAHILERDPAWDTLPATVSPALRRLLERCLEKDPHNRLRDAGDVGLALEDLDLETLPGIDSRPGGANTGLKILLGFVSAVAAILAILVWIGSPFSQHGESASTLRFSENTPIAPDVAMVGHYGSAVAISPDGQVLVWVGFTGEETRLYSRHLDEAEAQLVRGTEGALAPFFSPDGEQIGFWADRRLKKVAVRGGASQTICIADHLHGASWGDGIILMENTGSGVLSVVDPAGGQPERVGTSEMASFPKLLPGSKTALVNSLDGAQVLLVSLDTGEATPLINEGSNGSYVPTGHLLWTQGQNLLAAPFDLESLTLAGEAHTVVEGVLTEGFLTSHYAVSNEGTLVYLPAGSTVGGSQPTWVKLDGSTEPLPLPAESMYLSPRISPDGREVLVIRPAESSNLWLVEIDRGITSPVTDIEGSQYWAIWDTDSKHAIFNWFFDGEINLWTRPVDRSMPPRRLTTAPGKLHVPQEITRDGRTVLLEVAEGQTDNLAIHLLHLDGEPRIEELLVADANLIHPKLSPDDRWLAYASDATGRFEVYAQPFPNLGATIRVSPNGGQEPIWSPAGDRLYYRSIDGQRVYAVDVLDRSTLRLGKEKLVLEGKYVPGLRWGRGWDVHPDGERFLMLKIQSSDSPQAIRVVKNWFAELERLVPTNH